VKNAKDTEFITSYRGRCAEYVNRVNYSSVLQYSNVEPSPFFSTYPRNDAVTLPRVVLWEPGDNERRINQITTASFSRVSQSVFPLACTARHNYHNRRFSSVHPKSIEAKSRRCRIVARKRITNRVSCTKIDLSKRKISGMRSYIRYREPRDDGGEGGEGEERWERAWEGRGWVRARACTHLSVTRNAHGYTFAPVTDPSVAPVIRPRPRHT